MNSDSKLFRLLMRFYEAEARYSATGAPVDRHTMLATLHPNVVLYQPRSLPYGGEWRGREAVGRWLDSFTQTWTEITPTNPMFFACGKDILFSTVTLRARARSTHAEIDMPMCQIIRFDDELPIEWRNFAWDTAEMLEALTQRP